MQSKKITYSLTGDFVKYDKSYALTIYEDGGSSGETLVRGDIVVEDNLEIMRPYVDPTPLATSGTATDIALYQGYENLARAIIDAAVGGFYYDRTYLEVVGQVKQESRKTREGDTVTESDDTSVTVDDMVTESVDMSVNVGDTCVNDFEDIDD